MSTGFPRVVFDSVFKIEIVNEWLFSYQVRGVLSPFILRYFPYKIETRLSKSPVEAPEAATPQKRMLISFPDVDKDDVEILCIFLLISSFG